MRWLGKALLIWTPGFVSAGACRRTSAEFTALAARAAAKSGDEALGAFRAAAVEAGRRAAETLKCDLGLACGFEDAELAWRLVSKFSGMAFSVKRAADRSLFDHRVCPALAAGGPAMCRDFCIPFVEGLTRAMCPSCRLEVVEEANGETPCTKALVRGEGEDAR